MIVDAHQHFWNLERIHYPWLTPADAVLYRTIEPPELDPELRGAGVERTVLVQAANSYEETLSLPEIDDEYAWVAGVVGWVDLLHPDTAARQLDELERHPRFKGVRHLIHNEADPDWVVREPVLESLKVLASHGCPFDVVAVFPDHLKHVPTLADKVPGLQMVIDHLAKPPIREGGWEPWASQLAAAAMAPAVFAKLSGLNTAADWKTWSAADLKPYVDWALNTFGPERIMFGSDWPVATLAGDYQKVWRETGAVLQNLSEHERALILGDVATRFYRLD